MATATEAPASVTAEGPTSHTQNQAPTRVQERLSEQQIDFLLRGISPNRIGKDGKGFSHVEAWDIRRHLIRVFGFGGFDTDLLGAELVAQIDIPAGNKTRYTVVYRVSVKLTVKVGGVELGHWHGTAIGDATNQPGLADAHDLALKTADSQALKRAAVNMGDQFGLSLYNDGSIAPVVNRSLAYMKPDAEDPQLGVDPPVKPEPGSPVRTDEEQPDSAPLPDQRQQGAVPPTPTQQLVLTDFLRRVRNGWSSVTATEQSLAEARAKALLNELVPFGEAKVPTRVEDMLNARISQLKAAPGGDTERSAA
jgi:hypothetical protein